MIYNIMNNIISEKYTDGIVCKYGTADNINTQCSGVISNESGLPVNPNTLYDLASVTKIFSLITIFKLIEEGYFKLDHSIANYSNDFEYLNDIKIYELMNFSRKIVTDKRIDRCTSRVDALSLVYNAKCIPNSTPEYSDMGVIVLVELINKLVGSDTFFYEYTKNMWTSIGLKNTYWWFDIPKNMYPYTQCYDNEYKLISSKLICLSTPLGQVHDKKATALSVSGHAGVFSTAEDMSIFMCKLLRGQIISQESINCILDSTYDSYNMAQHYGLLCYKKAKTETKSEVPLSSSDKSIAISGYTGTHLLIDFEKESFVFIGANRINNRLTYSDVENVSYYVEGLDEIKGCSIGYVYRKDELVRGVVV